MGLGKGWENKLPICSGVLTVGLDFSSGGVNISLNCWVSVAYLRGIPSNAIKYAL